MCAYIVETADINGGRHGHTGSTPAPGGRHGTMAACRLPPLRKQCPKHYTYVRPERPAERRRRLSGRPLPGAGRRRLGQDARHHAENRPPDRGPRLRSPHYRRADLHQQGRAGNAGTHRQAAQAAQAGQAADGVDLPFAGCEDIAPGGARRRPEGPLFHHGQRRLRVAGAGLGDHHRQAADPPHPDRHLAVEERPGRSRDRAAAGQGRGRGAGRAHLPQLCGDPVGLPGRRFRRPDPPAGRAVPPQRAYPRQVAAPPALPADGRVPGHQHLPVRAGQAAGHRRRQEAHVHRRRRRRPGDLRVARRLGGKSENPADRFPRPASDQAGTELPLDHAHPAGRQRRHRQQSETVRESLWSEHGLGEPIKVLGMGNDEQEAEQVAIMISADHFERKNHWSDYAILYRGNHQARIIEQCLRKERIPYSISGGQSFFDKAEIKDIISYLRLLTNTDDDPAFIRAVTTPRRGVGQSTLETLGTFSGQWQCSLFEAVFKGGIEGKLNDGQLLPLRQFCNFINDLESRASRPGPSGSGDNAAQVLDDLMEAINYESYLYDMFDERAAQGKWQNVMEFTNWLKERGRGGKERDGDEKNVLELSQMVALMSMLEGQDEEPDAVRMSTLHASKGLEFPHVFLVGVEEGILPHKGDPDAPAETIGARIQEERRLMYVGITRAQRTLTVTWCKKRKRAGEQVHCDESRFIKEMQLDVGTAVPMESEVLTPKERLARMKELLNTPKG